MIIFSYLSIVIYFMLEFQRKTPVKENKGNKGSNILIGCAFMWMILIPTIIYSIYGNVKEPGKYLWTGVLIGLLGVYIRRSAIVWLGRYYSRNVGIQGEHQLIQTGWYRFIRHPGYLGTFLTFMGFAISMGMWVSVIINVVIFFIAYSYRIHIEEKTMTTEFGEQYDIYKKRTWRMIPFLY
jgi:protein-S-isoprenylcysteine O-methyltransferase Ste14